MLNMGRCSACVALIGLAACYRRAGQLHHKRAASTCAGDAFHHHVESRYFRRNGHITEYLRPCESDIRYCQDLQAEHIEHEVFN
jgi:hypothetical protein